MLIISETIICGVDVIFISKPSIRWFNKVYMFQIILLVVEHKKSPRYRELSIKKSLQLILYERFEEQAFHVPPLINSLELVYGVLWEAIFRDLSEYFPA